jgi:hypothetical protein
MDPTRKHHFYCADFPELSLPAPRKVQARLTITELAQLLAFVRRSDEALRARILRVRLIADSYPPDPS